MEQQVLLPRALAPLPYFPVWFLQESISAPNVSPFDPSLLIFCTYRPKHGAYPAPHLTPTANTS